MHGCCDAVFPCSHTEIMPYTSLKIALCSATCLTTQVSCGICQRLCRGFCVSLYLHILYIHSTCIHVLTVKIANYTHAHTNTPNILYLWSSTCVCVPGSGKSMQICTQHIGIFLMAQTSVCTRNSRV